MNLIKSMPKSLLGWGQNCFCSGLLFWASFWLSFFGMKMTVLACVKRLFLPGIFIKFFINMHYDFNLSTKRKAGRVIILLRSGEAEISNNTRRWVGQRKKRGFETHGEDFPYTDSNTPVNPFCLFLFPIFFPSTAQSGHHLSNYRPKEQQANKLKKIITENSYE